MGHLKKLRIFVGFFKDKASSIKTTFSTKLHKSSIHRRILRATTHGTSSPPSDKRIAAVLSFGHASRPTACACIGALMDRLHGTRNAFVALKCLFLIHHVITQGPFILKDQLSIYPSFGGRNYLNLSTFRDKSDPETWELSSWVRWYAGVLERNLMVSRVLGYYLSSSTFKKEERVLTLLNSELLGEIDVLVGFVEEISHVPNSFYLQKNNLVYQIVRLVSEDYRFLQSEISVRVVELGDRLMNLSLSELTRFSNGLMKFEDCKENLTLLFVNRKKNVGLWDLISETKMKVMETMNKKLEEKIWRKDESSELTCIRKLFAESEPLFRLRQVADRWMGLDQVPPTFATVRRPLFIFN